MNRKYKYLAKNVGILTISNFASKILKFFLVPLYTSILSTEEYGIFDLVNTTITLLIPLVTLDISEAALRFALDEKNDKKQVYSITLIYFFVGSLIVAALLTFNHIFLWYKPFDEYAVFFLIMFCVNTLNAMVSNFTRGLDKIKEIAISGVISSFVCIILNIVFLIPLHMGLKGYFLAYILGPLAQIVYQIFATKLWRYIGFRNLDRSTDQAMRNYSTPLILNDLGWWINSTSDRYVVIIFCGIAENGIYAVGSKIPMILRIFQSIFEQAWILSSVKDFDPEDKDGFFSNLYNIYSFLIVFICSVIILFNRPLARFMYAKDFYVAWRYVPFLTVAIVFSALSGYLGCLFGAAKDSKFSYLTMIGAIANLIMNIIFVQFIGALGAALATTISSWLVWMLRTVRIKRHIKLKFKMKRDYTAFLVLMIQSLVLLIMPEDTAFVYILETGLFLMNIVLYHNEVIHIWQKGKTVLKA